jgi:hypothetical protein
MVKYIRDSMKLNVRVRVGLVNQGGPNDAPAWVSYLSPLPPPNSIEFRSTLFTVFLRKSFLQANNFDAVVTAIAHELSHIVLFAVAHPLQECEVAVDLTAMLFGYRDFYFYSGEYLRTQDHWLGYLKPEEVRYAAGVLGRPPTRLNRPTPSAKKLNLTLAKAFIAASFVGAFFWLLNHTGSPAVEERPSAGTSQRFSESQMRYCLSEEIRLDGAKSVVNRYAPSEVSRFNLMVTDYNERCGNFQYRPGTLETVRSEVEAHRSLLWAAGASVFGRLDDHYGR